MIYCEGNRDWLACLKCERLCSDGCPLESADLDEIVRQLNMFEARRANFYLGGLDGPAGNA